MAAESQASNQVKGAALGLAAAVLFGASAPIAKLLLPNFGPLALAGLLYLGAGLSLSLFQLQRRRVAADAREAKLRGADVGYLVAIIMLGGVFGPVLMLFGLERLSGLAASLLLNLEAPLTVLLAVVLFREHLGLRQMGSVTVVLFGAFLLSHKPGELHADWLGSLAIAAACLCWAIDNNLTQRLSLRDPIALVQWKTLGAGTLTLLVSIIAGQSLRGPLLVVAVLLFGSLSYGLSIVLDTYALRLIGAAREAAFFSTAPLVGALLSIPLLGEVPSWTDGAAALLMLMGVGGLLREHHGHSHSHDALAHDHAHTHDEHHRHAHEGAVTEPHSHPHRHVALTHDHPHVSDAHHRHSHRYPSSVK